MCNVIRCPFYSIMDDIDKERGGHVHNTPLSILKSLRNEIKDLREEIYSLKQGKKDKLTLEKKPPSAEEEKSEEKKKSKK